MRARPTRATVALVVVTVAAHFTTVATRSWDTAVALGGFVPALAGQPGMLARTLVTPLSATLLHGGIIHLGFNMLMLGFVGRQVEVALGARGLLLLYVLGAYAGALAQWAAGPASPVPMIGASGAISALVAAYAILYGQRRRMRPGLPANLLNILWLAAAWIGLQLLVAVATWDGGVPGSGSAVAVAAHIGGFLAGLALARPLLRLRYRNA